MFYGTFYRRFGKRTLDVVAGSVMLVACSPLLLVVAAILKASNGGRVLFLQKRPGLNGIPFTIYKFRTMTDARGPDGNLLPDSARLTRAGRFVRSCSLDELLQLVNVVRGDMSLVGPRPLLMEYVPHYSSAQWRRHGVRPGITGLAQVNGRNALSWERRFRYDTFYADHISLRLDCALVLRTLARVVRRENTEFPAALVDTKFDGSRRGARATRRAGQAGGDLRGVAGSDGASESGSGVAKEARPGHSERPIAPERPASSEKLAVRGQAV